MKKKLVLLVCIYLSVPFEQAFSVTSVVKLMCWNLLNFPNSSDITGDTTLRLPYYRAVVQYVNPDILVTEENTSSSGTTWFLNSAMNQGSGSYSKGTFISGYDTENEIYYKTSLFSFVSNIPIHTKLRDINEFKLVHISTGDTIRIYAVHLKASSGTDNDSLRGAEVDSLRKVTNKLPAGSNFIVCGDFNFYGDYELGYLRLLQDNVSDDGNFTDPISLSGTWHYYPYRFYHTQSTRTTSFGGGATGGLNDRFDMIIFSRAIQQGLSGVSYVAGSTTPVGNDGSHYNLDINTMPNTAVTQTLADALHYASDHLPVFANFNFSTVTGITFFENNLQQLLVFPNPADQHLTLTYKVDKAGHNSIKVFDLVGKEVLSFMDENQTVGIHKIEIESIKSLESGIYFIQCHADNQFISTKFIKR